MHQEPEGPNFFDDLRLASGLLWFLCRMWGTSLEVFLHVGMGVRYPGVHGACTLLFMPLFSLGWPHADPVPLWIYLGTYLAMCMWQRAYSWTRSRSQRAAEHSFYNGYPVLCAKFPRLSEHRAKQTIEPILAIAFGYVTSLWNAPLGWYLVGGGASLWLSHSMSSRLHSEEFLDMQDSMLEQRQLAERFREMRGED